MYQKFIGECDCSVIGGMFYYPTAKRTYDAKPVVTPPVPAPVVITPPPIVKPPGY